MRRFVKYLFFLNAFTSVYLYVIYKFRNIKRISFSFLGRKCYLRPGTSDFSILNQIFFDEQYDPLGYVKTPRVILDAGANIGISSIYYNRIFPLAKIYSFEPDKNNFEILTLNTNTVDSIKVIPNGIWSKTCDIYLNKKTGNADFFISEVPTDATIGSIACVSISDFIIKNGIDKIDILKLDIEGAEKVILESNPDEWLAKTDCIMIETHDRFVYGCSHAVFKALSNYEYVLEVSGETLKFFNIKSKSNA